MDNKQSNNQDPKQPNVKDPKREPFTLTEDDLRKRLDLWPDDEVKISNNGDIHIKIK